MSVALKFLDALPCALVERLRAMPTLAVAFSGGLDSRFLCHAASICGSSVLALHVCGPHVPRRDSEAARSWAERNNIAFASSYMNPLEIGGLAENGRKRCYFCKKAAFGKISSLAREYFKDRFYLCDGGNRDDEREYRPGLEAARELGFFSPLSEAGLDKKAIRHYALLSGLEDPGQKARPCLLTRFPYGQSASLDRLACVEKIEGEIEAMLAEQGEESPDFRLRMGAVPELHIKPISSLLLNKIAQILENNRFAHCAIIQTEKISGYYDRAASTS